MRKILSVLIIIFTSSTIFSQTNEKEAFQTYKRAREAFQNENFETSSKLLLKTKELLGSTNIRIQPMLIRSLVNIEDWRQAKTEITTYYGLKPDKELVEYQEIVNLENKIDTKIYEEEQLYSRAKSNKSVYQYQSYLNKYPYGKYRSEVQNRLGNQKDENAWEIAKNKSSTSAYYEYLVNFPNGNYATTARETIKRWDKEAYNKAVSEGTQEALNNYLNNYPRGKYRYTVRNKLNERKEYDEYMYAKSNNNIEDYEAYIRKYPNGKYASEVNRVIENRYYKLANETYASKNYRQAKRHYETYISKFPYGSYSSDVRKKIKKCERKARNKQNLNKLDKFLWGESGSWSAIFIEPNDNFSSINILASYFGTDSPFGFSLSFLNYDFEDSYVQSGISMFDITTYISANGGKGFHGIIGYKFDLFGHYANENFFNANTSTWETNPNPDDLEIKYTKLHYGIGYQNTFGSFYFGVNYQIFNKTYKADADSDIGFNGLSTTLKNSSLNFRVGIYYY